MDLISNPQQSNGSMSTEGVALVIIVSAVWILDFFRRSGHASPEQCLIDAALKLRSLALEVSLLLVAGASAFLLLYRGRHEGAPIPVEDEEIWHEIKNEWPLLTTADSLLGLQSLLRLVVLLSATLRLAPNKDSKSAFLGSCGLFFLSAAVVRVMLLVMSPQDVYHLDGPLGGNVNFMVEVSSLLLLMILNLRCFNLSMARMVACAFAITCVTLVAEFNCLEIADENSEFLDVLFSLNGLLELLGAISFTFASLWISGTSAAFEGFVHVILPVQQLFAAIFLLTAWVSEEEQQSLVRRGYPFQLLQASYVLQVGLYLIATTVRVTDIASVKENEMVMLNNYITV
jgi:hypothetical protein